MELAGSFRGESRRRVLIQYIMSWMFLDGHDDLMAAPRFNGVRVKCIVVVNNS